MGWRVIGYPGPPAALQVTMSRAADSAMVCKVVGSGESRLPRGDQVTRPPRLDMILAESAVSRPCGFAVASRALTRRPRSSAGSYEEDGGRRTAQGLEPHQVSA